MLSVAAKAQDGKARTHAWYDNFAVGTASDFGMKSHVITLMTFTGAIDYCVVPQVCITAVGTNILGRCGGSLGVPRTSWGATCLESLNIGGGIGGTVCRLSDQTCFDLRGNVTSGIFNSRWKNTAYSVGFDIVGKLGYIHSILAVGYEYVDSHTPGVPDYSGLMLRLGTRYMF